MSRQRLNEETVKNRYLVPYLEKLGLTREELDFESSFTLRLGRQKGQPPVRRGRLDILVRRGIANLMVVEAKAEGETLTDDDRDQAISYARFLDQIAPLALVTNGSDFRLYDTITKKAIQEDEVDPTQHFQVVMPPDLLALRDEALTLFLGYSPENLAVFCHAQVSAGISQLRGSVAERNKKYIPELFVPRGDLRDQIISFFSSPLPLFALLGDSGLGKTCSLCAATESLLNSGVAVLFYRGSTLPNVPLLQTIADDFSWEFAEEETARNLIQRLRLILRGRPLIIVVDAIDEWSFPARMQDLLVTARRLSGTDIKILLSCKVRVWEEFSTTRGEPTGIKDFLFGGDPYRLPPMSQEEFHEAIDRYSTFYRVKGVFEDTALDAARQSPFLFRVLFEVAEKHGDEYLTFSSLQFFHTYYEQLTARLEDPKLGDIVLRDVARLMFDRNSERIRLYDLSRAVGLENVPAVVGELLRFQILEIAKVEGDEYLFFYFSLLRDYLIAFRVYEWHRLPSPKLLEILREVSDSSVHIEALAFFYRYAETEQKRIIDSSLFDRAKAYVELYDEALRTHFPRFREQFSPYTQGEIGFVAEFILNRNEIGLYGFRERKSSEEVVLLLPYPRYKSDSNLLYFYGAEDLHWYSSFESDIPNSVLNDEVRSQLQRIVDQGLLDESPCPELAAEAVAVEVARDRAIFSDKRNARSAGPVFPLSLSRVRYWLRYELLHYHFDRVRQDDKLRSGELEVNRHEDGGISYSWSPTLEDMDWIASQVEAHVNESEDEVRRLARRPHVDLEKLDARVSRALDILDGAGMQTIESHPFVDAVELWGRPYVLSLKNACEFIERVLTYTLPIIRQIVEHNFPTIAHEFKTLFTPFVGIAAVNLERENVWRGATLYLCEPDPGQEDVRFIARNYRDIETRIVRDPSFRFEVCCDGVWRKRTFEGFAGQRSVRFSTFLHPSHDYLGSRHNSRSFGAVYPVIRAIVYDWIRQEMAGAFDALCKMYGITKRDRDWTFFPQSRN